MSKPSIPARAVRLKNFREYLLDYDKPSDTWFDTNFIYSDTGEDVPKDALVVPWEDDVPADKLRRLEDILGAYASKRGWDYMEIGDEEPR